MPHSEEKRRTTDLDFAVRGQIEDDDYADLGHVVDIHTRKKMSPRGYGIDVHDRRVIGGISLDYILDKAKTFSIGGGTLRAISLEGLPVLKHRAGRGKDTMDMRLLARTRGRDIDWDEIARLSKHDVELAAIRDKTDRMMRGEH